MTEKNVDYPDAQDPQQTRECLEAAAAAVNGMIFQGWSEDFGVSVDTPNYTHLRDALGVNELLLRWSGIDRDTLKSMIYKREIKSYQCQKKLQAPDGHTISVCVSLENELKKPYHDILQEDSWLAFVFSMEDVERLEGQKQNAYFRYAVAGDEKVVADIQPTPNSDLSHPPLPEERKERRFEVTQKHAATLCGVSLRTIQKWDGGKGKPVKYPGRTDLAVLIIWADGYKQKKSLLRNARGISRARSMDPQMLDAMENENAFD